MSQNIKMDSVSTSNTLAENSDIIVPSQKAVKSYVNNQLSDVTSSSTFGTITVSNAIIESSTVTESTTNTATITDLRTVNLVDVATETSSGITNQIVFGTSSIFVCTATDTWKKVNYDSW